MGAYYTTGGGHSLIPQVVTGQQSTETHSDNSGYGFNALAPIAHEAARSRPASTDPTGTAITWVPAPAEPLTRSTLLRRCTRPEAVILSERELLRQSERTTDPVGRRRGWVVPGLNSNESSNSLDLHGQLPVTRLLPNLQTSAFVERRTQLFLGENYGVNSYGGSATYSHALLDGTFNATVSVTANTSDQNRRGYSGLFDQRRITPDEILGWHVNGSFGYAQNVQTLLVTYMNSFYNYSGNAKAELGKIQRERGRRRRADRVDRAGRHREQQPELQRQCGLQRPGSQPPAATPNPAGRRWRLARVWCRCRCPRRFCPRAW